MKKLILFSIGIVYLTILFFNSSTVIAHDNLPSITNSEWAL